MRIDSRVEAVVERIIEDLQDRSGLGNAWDDIDPETQDEIRVEWKQFIRDGLDSVLL